MTHTRETVASAVGDWHFNFYFSPLNMWLIRKLVQYGVMKGLLRRLHKYPIDLKRAGDSTSKMKSVSRYFDGAHSYDDICAKTGEFLYDPQNMNILGINWCGGIEGHIVPMHTTLLVKLCSRTDQILKNCSVAQITRIACELSVSGASSAQIF